jgi:hypothetical protein
MISTKLLNTTLDAIKNANPVAELAENLANSGTTEEQLHAALKGRLNDPIAVELMNCHRDALRGVPSTNKYGITRTAASTRKSTGRKK